MDFSANIPAVPKTGGGHSLPTAEAQRASVPARSGIVPGETKKSKGAGYVGIIIAGLVIAVPLYFVVITSFKPHPDIYSNPISWVPSPWAPENYSYVWNLSLIHI